MTTNTTPSPDVAENALQELEGSDFSAVREHATTLRTALAALTPAQDDRLVEPTTDEIIELINVVTDLHDADAIDKAYPEVFERMKRFALRASNHTALRDEPVAVRYDFDGYGWKYLDSGSGSDWLTRIPDAEPLFAKDSVKGLGDE